MAVSQDALPADTLLEWSVAVQPPEPSCPAPVLGIGAIVFTCWVTVALGFRCLAEPVKGIAVGACVCVCVMQYLGAEPAQLRPE